LDPKIPEMFPNLHTYSENTNIVRQYVFIVCRHFKIRK
jgi:hypothetical protein